MFDNDSLDNPDEPVADDTDDMCVKCVSVVIVRMDSKSEKVAFIRATLESICFFWIFPLNKRSDCQR